MSQKIRTIITQDAEVDDQNSLRHFLLYANEVELQGIVQTSSIFHWIGVEGAKKPVVEKPAELSFIREEGAYDQPYRWPGTDWMFREIDDYEAVYPNLIRQSPDYPSPDYLRSITKIGNIGYPGETLGQSEGSELIRKAILDDDPRTLYLQVWGGSNTIARALMDIESEYKDTEGWENLHQKLSEKIVITACGEQDDCYRDYIAEVWPQIQFVHCMQMGSYAYPWCQMPEGESKASLRASFMYDNILHNKGPLLAGYATWMDGKYYEGESDGNQFGANMHLQDDWWGHEFGIGPYEKYDFLSEGDSPTYFCLFDWGLRTLENFSYGGFGGRQVKDENEKNSKGEALNYWKPQQDAYIDADGNTVMTEAMWRYTADIQHDFAARADWCVASASDETEHAPSLVVKDLDVTASAGSCVSIKYEVSEGAVVTARIYPEPSTVSGAKLDGFDVTLPLDASAGQTLHVILQAKNTSGHQLTHYQRVIITIA